jgi:hypothetical protein
MNNRINGTSTCSLTLANDRSSLGLTPVIINDPRVAKAGVQGVQFQIHFSADQLTLFQPDYAHHITNRTRSLICYYVPPLWSFLDVSKNTRVSYCIREDQQVNQLQTDCSFNFWLDTHTT